MAKIANQEPLPGYRLVEPLGKGGFGEVWKCEVPGGLFKAVKFVTGADNTGLHRDVSGAEQELRSFNLIKTIRHPFILSVERVECVENELVIVMELADRSLHDVLESWQKAGHPGVPRGELLSYLSEAAEALDVINLEYGLQHLDVKPRNLFLVGGHVKVGDFGLVSSLADLSSGTLNLGAITPLYTAPESFVGKITLFSDQYSLAVAYHELLTGAFPFDGKNFRQLAMQHSAQPPNLDRLPEGDRPIVARALAKDPRQRFASCAEFFQALQAIPSPPPPPRVSRRVPVLRLPAAPPPTPVELPAVSARETRTNLPGPRSNLTRPVETPPVAPSRPAPPAGGSGGVVPGHEFLECVGRAPTGEVWKARTEDGEPRLVKLVAGFDPGAAGGPGGPLDRLRNLRHPVLADVDVIVTESKRLAVLSAPVECTLADRLRECQEQRLAGIPRGELLGYLAEVAQCLDELGNDAGLSHLALTPRALALTADGVQVLDFGLAELVWLPGGIAAAALNPRYTAPELIAGQVRPTSDQYGLAMIYAELLTGAHPLRGVNPRQAAAPKNCRPDLSLVPAPDRPALLKALSVDPDRRFATCSELVRALVEAVPDVEILYGRRARASGIVAALTSSEPPAPASLPQLNKLLGEVVARARGQFEVRRIGEARYLLHPGRKIEHQCHARLLPTALKVQLHGFRQEWGAKVVSAEAHSHVFQVTVGSSVWKRLLGRTSSLQVTIRFLPPDGSLNALTPVSIEIAPVGSLGEQSRTLLEGTGPKLLESLRTHLQAQPERRRQERLSFDQPVPVAPVLENGRAGKVMTARAVNISSGGMRLRLPCEPPTENLFIELRAPTAPAEPVSMPARIVRTEACADGSYDVGVSFGLE